MLLVTLLFDASPVAGDKILQYMVCQFYYIVFWAMALRTYHIKQSFFFAIRSDDPLDDESVLIRIVVVSLAECTVFG